MSVAFVGKADVIEYDLENENFVYVCSEHGFLTRGSQAMLVRKWAVAHWKGAHEGAALPDWANARVSGAAIKRGSLGPTMTNIEGSNIRGNAITRIMKTPELFDAPFWAKFGLQPRVGGSGRGAHVHEEVKLVGGMIPYLLALDIKVNKFYSCLASGGNTVENLRNLRTAARAIRETSEFLSAPDNQTKTWADKARKKIEELKLLHDRLNDVTTRWNEWKNKNEATRAEFRQMHAQQRSTLIQYHRSELQKSFSAEEQVAIVTSEFCRDPKGAILLLNNTEHVKGDSRKLARLGERTLHHEKRLQDVNQYDSTYWHSMWGILLRPKGVKKVGHWLQLEPKVRALLQSLILAKQAHSLNASNELMVKKLNTLYEHAASISHRSEFCKTFESKKRKRPSGDVAATSLRPAASSTSTSSSSSAAPSAQRATTSLLAAQYDTGRGRTRQKKNKKMKLSTEMTMNVNSGRENANSSVALFAMSSSGDSKQSSTSRSSLSASSVASASSSSTSSSSATSSALPLLEPREVESKRFEDQSKMRKCLELVTEAINKLEQLESLLVVLTGLRKYANEREPQE